MRLRQKHAMVMRHLMSLAVGEGVPLAKINQPTLKNTLVPSGYRLN